jgi:uncharacterized membrane protein
MTEQQLVLLVIAGVLYIICGAIIAVAEICNKEITTPHDLYSDGYDWFGSWTIFLIKSFMTFPFWILFTIIYLVYKFIRWLFTVRGARA